MEQKLNKLCSSLSSLVNKTILFALIMFNIGCKNTMEHKLIDNDYQDMISSYELYYGFDLDNPKETMGNFQHFIDSNFEDIAYINEKKYHLQLRTADSVIVIKSSNVFDRTTIPIKINLNKAPYDYCQSSSLSTMGYFSKEFKTLDYKYISILDQYLKNSFSDSISIPVYNNDNLGDIRSIATFKFNKNEMALLCSRNFENEQLQKIQDSLYLYITQDPFDFDYAIIPVGKSY